MLADLGLETLLVAATLAAVMGATLGLLGGGGSILAVPLLLHVVHRSTERAVAESLLLVALAAAAALIPHARKRRVRWRAGLVFATVSGAVAYGVGRASVLIPSDFVLGVFIGVTVLTGVLMLRPRRAPAPDAPPPSAVRLVSHAAAVGALSGLVGAGGGFLIVPALVVMGRMTMRDAVGTSLLVIALNSALGFAAHASHVAVDYALIALLGAAAMFGSLLGALACERVSGDTLRRAFGVLVLAVGAATAYASWLR